MSDMTPEHLADAIDPRTAEPGTNILTFQQLAALHYAGICLAQRDELIAAADALRAMGWRKIAEAPRTEPAHDAPRVLLYSPEFGVQMGHVYVYADHISARAEGFHGEWNITHYMPLPSPPEEKEG